jgi:hypothetical protein
MKTALEEIMEKGGVVIYTYELQSVIAQLKEINGREITPHSLSKFGEPVTINGKEMYLISSHAGTETVIKDICHKSSKSVAKAPRRRRR